jgi:phage terminase large subunit-like protein
MPWQRQVLEVALELLPGRTHRLAYRQVILTVPRQSGKTTLLLILILLRALGIPRQNIKYTAQTGGDARDKWMDDWLPVLESSEFASQFRPRKTNGHESLIFRNGSRQGLVATTKKSGHGGVLDLGILDEAFAHPDARLEQALSPGMNTRRSPQLWIVSTAGTPDDSPYLWSKVEAGRRMVEDDVREGTAYFEWSASEDADPGDEDMWWSCMPALGFTTPVEAIRAEFGKLPLSEFRRAYLNQWVSALSDPVIPLAKWNVLTDCESSMVDPVVLAYDVTPDHGRAAIAAAGRRPDGLLHVEVVDQRARTEWLPARLAQLAADHGATVVADPSAPGAGLLPALKLAGVSPVEINGRQLAQGCGIFNQAVLERQVRHLGTLELVTALDGAAKRPLGDSWAWSRKSSNVDISPLVAVTLALWGLVATAEGELGPEDVYVGSF